MIATPTKARPAGSTGALQFRDALGKFKGTSGLTFNDTANTLAFVGAAQTANNPLLDLSQPWNNAAVAFTGLRFNAIDTASASSSFLLLLQTNGVTQLSVTKAGKIDMQGSIFHSQGLLGNSTSVGYYTPGQIQGVVALALGAAVNTPDTYFYRDAAGIFAQRNGINAQAFRVYNTYTDANNGEWGALRWNANVLEIGAFANGTGQVRNLQIKSYSTQIHGVATFFATASGTISIGINPVSNGVAFLSDNTGVNFGRLQLGGTTSAFPAIKRSAATLQARLADDTGFTFIQGKLQTDAPAVVETLVLMRSITVYDSTGTAYKVPCT